MTVAYCNGCAPPDRRHTHGIPAALPRVLRAYMEGAELAAYERWLAEHPAMDEAAMVAALALPLPTVDLADPYWGVVPYPLPIPVQLARGEARDAVQETVRGRAPRPLAAHSLSRRRR